MDNKKILERIDYTNLKPDGKLEDIIKLAEEAIEYEMASVCIQQTYIERIRERFEDLKICTVIGFPLGYNLTETKIMEAKESVAKGADEIDMVINITDVKNGDYKKVEEEIREIKNAIGEKILKVIIETCYLNEEEKIQMCKAVTNAGADYIKTSTGFGPEGAKLEDIKLFKEHLGPDVKIKGAGGIRTKEELENFIEAGCDRIGSSSVLDALN